MNQDAFARHQSRQMVHRVMRRQEDCRQRCRFFKPHGVWKPKDHPSIDIDTRLECVGRHPRNAVAYSNLFNVTTNGNDRTCKVITIPMQIHRVTRIGRESLHDIAKVDSASFYMDGNFIRTRLLDMCRVPTKIGENSRSAAFQTEGGRSIQVCKCILLTERNLGRQNSFQLGQIPHACSKRHFGIFCFAQQFPYAIV